ncbi:MULTISPECIES: BON domain-containing protein [Burkholderiaceae]|uniref:BON domain-containing protein n=1 Tax=Burkholderiaceae TaxID=119060 RepID=UPI000967F342|nr:MULTISPECIES: BON domain-containing protein [Burkholderiaceae]MCF2134665.1 BON domain-containing protein [Mycetohabitans sp. B3]MCG1019173.1 BON domain-containing protein [Mycetohabitans sp. B4]MCG1039969.1 BON domain-containing protein [Mycetohabitans sp. B7]SIT71946.1 hyperosmotically inducible protein [Burkholderia sp. b14]SIT73071.1 hyperosmotically inducible protein [Burkholderia sp. b13]
MQTTRWIRVAIGIICAAHVVGLAAQSAGSNRAAPLSGSETLSEKISDGAITTKVKAALLNAKGVKGFQNIHVKTTAGAVRLTGTVPSREVKEAAADAARTVDGVTHVHNDLHIAN